LRPEIVGLVNVNHVRTCPGGNFEELSVIGSNAGTQQQVLMKLAVDERTIIHVPGLIDGNDFMSKL
jgi:hypothetical protein